ncbi:hypothetical protein KORDIASMS9_04190 [Kordia sp. SMS9]|uniref:hypothetical protein n=1 Tax=Kordia sp. SMS9 TaxID=2282170 RepID=UPI000E0DFF8A|nr:hypothetical protein [Kordia sp. SMS9]AXG71932.1 hypothetical protein KORDIASMS9_04190 [Kordia sp. SMS9]
MKNKLSFVILVFGLLTSINTYAQTNWILNTPLNPTSSALGDQNQVPGTFSGAFGFQNIVEDSYSNAFGAFNTVRGVYSYSFGLHSETTKPFSFAAGRYVQAAGINSFVFGKGATTTNKLVNSKDYSFLVGFKNKEPGFFVSRNSDGPIVGVATDDPQARLDVHLGDKQEIRIQSEIDNTYGGLSFRDHVGNETWRIRAFNNFTGGYNSILSIVSSKKHDLWISAGKTMIGDWFDFDPCTDCDDYELFVKKGIRTQKIKVDVAAGVWADYVFKSDYELKPLEEVETFINTNGHLPNVPSAKEVEENGVNLGEMDAKLLEKIEELTLYVIELKKEINELKRKQ